MNKEKKDFKRMRRQLFKELENEKTRKQFEKDMNTSADELKKLILEIENYILD